jgi:hypothetical protein
MLAARGAVSWPRPIFRLAELDGRLGRASPRKDSQLRPIGPIPADGPAKFFETSRQISRDSLPARGARRFGRWGDRHPGVSHLRRRHLVVSQSRISGGERTPIPGRRLPLHLNERLPTGSPVAPPIARLGTELEPTALQRRHSAIHSKRQPTRYPATTDYFPATRRYCRPTIAVGYA